MPRSTRAHTIDNHLHAGGFVHLRLDLTQQRSGPDGHDTDGFATRQLVDADGVLVVAVGAYGPNWLRNLEEIGSYLERPHVRCTVLGEAPGIEEHEVLVRWATSEELRARRASQAARTAEVVAGLRRQEAAQRAEEGRRALEAAGQAGLF
ncbi:hypothetical protein ACWDXD_24910 [Streptomyces sp. NPDC003314]